MTRLEEIAVKLNRIRTLMEKKGLSGVFLKRQDDFAWITGGGKNYVGLGEMGNAGILVTMKDACCITNVIEKPRMIYEEGLEDLGFKVIGGPWHDGSFEKLSVEKLCSGGKVGCDFGASYGENIATEIKTLRASLTESEIEHYREVGNFIATALETTAKKVNPGDSEFSVCAKMNEIILDSGYDMISMMVAGDDRIRNYRHPIPTANTVQKRVQLGGNFKKYGLVVCLTRYINFEKPSEQLEKQFFDNQKLDCMIMEYTKPGRTLADVLRYAQKTYADLGYADEFEKHHQGGPIGYAARDYRVDFSHEVPIQEKQAFCWNPSITGTKSEDTILVSSDGFEILTKSDVFKTRDVMVGDKVYQRAMPLEKY